MNETILNLTQHKATPEQISSGVVDLNEDQRSRLIKLLTFEELPEVGEIYLRAIEIATMAATMGATKAMIGGAPFLMSHLEGSLKNIDIEPMYAFSKRVVNETINSDGSVTKTAVFKHVGFVKAA